MSRCASRKPIGTAQALMVAAVFAVLGTIALLSDDVWHLAPLSPLAGIWYIVAGAYAIVFLRRITSRSS